SHADRRQRRRGRANLQSLDVPRRDLHEDGADILREALRNAARPLRHVLDAAARANRGVIVSRLVVRCFSLSIDGYGAGPNQDLEHPLGVNGPELFDWFFRTRTWRAMHDLDGGDSGVDDEFAAKGMSGLGAWILGRNMFGPIRGPWPDESWKGWWG